MKCRKAIRFFVLCAVLLIGVSGGIGATVGSTLPKIETYSIEGLPVSIQPSEGKYLLVSFLKTDDLQSVLNIKELIVLYRRFHDYGLEMVSVFTDTTEEPILNLAMLWQFPWPLVSDWEVKEKKPTEIFGIDKIPRNVLLDSKRQVVAIDLNGEAAHQTLGQLLHLDLDQIPMPEPPVPKDKVNRVNAMNLGMGMGALGASGEKSQVTVLRQYGYPNYVDPVRITAFRAVRQITIEVLQKNSGADLSCGWYQDDTEHLLFEGIEGELPPKSIDPGNEPFGVFITARFGNDYKWFTDPNKNNLEKHARIYPMLESGVRVPNAYLITWEDMPVGMLDDDFQDVVLRIDGVRASTEPDPIMEAIEAVTAYGGFLEYDESGRVVQVNLVYGKDDLGQRVDCQNPSDQVLRYVPRFVDIEQLLIQGSQATDESMRFVGQLKTLKELYMWGGQVSDKGVEYLVRLENLEYLHLSDSSITDQSLSSFTRLKKLEDLSLQGNNFTDRGLKYLTQIPALKSLWIGLGKGKITDEGIAYLANLINLEILDLQNTLISDEGLNHLKGLTQLKGLYLSNTRVTQSGIEMIEKAIPGLKVHS